MSDVSQGEGWWLASDGKWYPPASAPPSIAAPVPPGYGMSPAPGPQRTNGLAVASLVLGIAGFVSCAVAAIPGLITGIIARKQIREAQGAESGEGLATAGIITSIVALVLVIGFVGVIVLITLLGTEASSKFSAVGTVIS